MFWYHYADRMYAGSRPNEARLNKNGNIWTNLWWERVNFSKYQIFRYGIDLVTKPF